ncbi:hypothetical protein C770_GR4pC0485 (plasmid) [Sinorhizobium meliloti GR4]|nr:hypothetical protein C770_GR4pC0485 [Sinorhizobium meliloti GR4]
MSDFTWYTGDPGAKPRGGGSGLQQAIARSTCGAG